MKKLLLVSYCSLFFLLNLFAQESTLKGIITDSDTGEPLIGATIMTEGSVGTVTDFDGGYSLNLKNGDHTLVVSYVSYDTKEIPITINGDQVLDIKMAAENLLNEVVVTADIAIARETPVAFTNISSKQIQEELGAQDIPMILNSTPGVYATESGGGDGDARITIRGFNQRNIAIMLDGIPVNDMENGWVYWSNWFGLDLVTQTMQVQRGLGASKLSIPSIGGTVNILTKGIDAKRSLKFKQEVGNNGFTRSTIGLTSGRLKNGFGVSAAASYKQGDGWVDGNFTRGFFYYLRLDKQFGDHMVSLSGFGAPQEHGQRPFTAPIALVDADVARDNGVPQEAIDQTSINGNPISDRGRRFNSHWGMRDGEVFNARKNYYHKPQFSFRHSWQINDRMFWSNVAYLSVGRGGGTAPDGLPMLRTEDGQFDIDSTIVRNQTPNPFSNPDTLSSTIIRSSNNDHFWYGFLSNINYKILPNLTLSAGVDIRDYRGDHYRSVYDLLGGTGWTVNNNYQEGDKIEYDYTSTVGWLGGYGLLEYKHRDLFTAFVNVSTANSRYGYIDNWKESTVEIDPISIMTTTFKAGAKYNINDNNSIFTNIGYLSRAQRFTNVIITNFWAQGLDATVANDYDNEIIRAFELGYNFKSAKFSMNVNGYYTIWNNKPLDRLPVAVDPDDAEERIPININGIDALHTGIEIDFIYKPVKKLSIEGLASIGDWRWTSAEEGSIVFPSGAQVDFNFDAEGVHVGDAAQVQFGGLVRYEPIKSLYFKLKGTYFGKNFADFQPEDLQDENAGRDSWQLPDYAIFSFHSGYNFNIKKVNMSLRANILNLFDSTFITDARNNDDFNEPAFEDFDAKSASVHFGQGRRYTLSLQINI
ncbi:MAG: TonB-dependent receptor [Saprospiraceae bacterium]